MKLIIQIPCYNEAETLPVTIGELPTSVPGVDKVEFLVVNDGSTDNTSEVARKLGVHHVLDLPHQGLALTFIAGMEHALELGADILVNTDGDNQYPAKMIPALVEPILKKKAHMVIGERDVDNPHRVPALKRMLYGLGASVVNALTGLKVKDPTSGFRAFSREAMLRITSCSEFSYTLDTIIQLSKKRLPIATIEIIPNPALRESRLFKSMWRFVVNQSLTILRVYLLYEPFKVFSALGVLFLTLSLLLFGRYAVFFFQGAGRGHVQSFVLGGVMLVLAVLSVFVGLVAEQVRGNRALLEDILYRMKRG